MLKLDSVTHLPMTDEFKESILKSIHLIIDIVDDESKVELNKEADQWRFNIITTKPEEIIGKDGELIRSIQHIARVLVHKIFPEDRTHFLIDVNNYRQNREHAISKKIPDIAQKEVLDIGNTVILVGLSGYERLQVHQYLSEIKGLSTTSVGPEDNRKLLIMPTSETGSNSMDNAKIVDINRL